MHTVDPSLCFSEWADVISVGDLLQVRDLRPGGTVLTLKGPGTAEVLEALRVLVGGPSPQALLDLASKQKRTYEAMCRRLLLERQPTGARTNDTPPFPPFQPIEVENGLWAIRRNLRIFLFDLDTIQDAYIVLEQLLYRSVHREDADLRQALASNSSQQAVILGARSLTADVLSPWAAKAARGFDHPTDLVLQDGVLVSSEVVPPYRSFDRSDLDDDQYRIVTSSYKSGLVPYIRQLSDPRQAFAFPAAAYESSRRAFSHFTSSPEYHFGVDTIPGKACLKAVMESLERFCCLQRSDDLVTVYATASDLGSSAVDVDECVKYSDEQLKDSRFLRWCAPFSATEAYEWTLFDTFSGAGKLLPTQLVTYGPQRTATGKPFFSASSSGCAAHVTVELALEAALAELIERDALMAWWLNRSTPPRIAPTTLSDPTREALGICEHLGYEAHILDLTLDSLPVALAIARHKSGRWPAFFCGASCAPHFAAASNKACYEMLLSMWYRLRPGDKLSLTAPEAIEEPLHHEAYYLDPVTSRVVAFLFDETTETRDVTSTRNVTASSALRSAGFEVFYRDITAPEVCETVPGVRVVRAVVPGLIPITFGFLRDCLGLPRIADARRQMRCSGADRLPAGLSIDSYQPHFFP